MKKIFSICLILVVAAGFVACSDNDDAGNSYLQENTIKVIASNLTFSPLAQTGGVKFTAPAGSTVSVDEEGSAWAKAEVRGDSVVVSVSHNPRLDSRSAILTIKMVLISSICPSFRLVQSSVIRVRRSSVLLLMMHKPLRCLSLLSVQTLS